LEAKPIFT